MADATKQLLLAVGLQVPEITHEVLRRNREAVEIEVTAWFSDPENMRSLLARIRAKEAGAQKASNEEAQPK